MRSEVPVEEEHHECDDCHEHDYHFHGPSPVLDRPGQLLVSALYILRGLHHVVVHRLYLRLLLQNCRREEMIQLRYLLNLALGGPRRLKELFEFMLVVVNRDILIIRIM